MMFSGIVSLQAQTPHFTQYLYNPTIINPAFAGNTGTLSAMGTHRSQWTGFENAPSTQTLSVHSPINGRKVGLGMSAINDNLGEERFFYLNGDFSYTLQISRETYLAFGLKAGFTHYSMSKSFFNSPEVQNDPYFIGYSNRWLPNIGVGTYLYGKKWYMAFSALSLLNNDFVDLSSETELVASDRTSLYLTGGYAFDMGRSMVFKPTAIIRSTDGYPVSVDLGGNLIFSENYGLGVNYRFDFNVLGILGSLPINERLKLGYAYEFPLSDDSRQLGGTHEFFLRFDLVKQSR